MPVYAVAEKNGLDRRPPESTPFQPNFRGHIKELDALRALGLCLVLIDHFWPEGLSYLVFQLGNAGWIAMDSFFVMSGVLITGILLDSKDKPGYYSKYYARRSLRIFPLYYLVLFLLWAIARLTNSGIFYHEIVTYWFSPAWFTFYAGNIREAVVGFPKSLLLGNYPALGYAVLWSLQIEEQFYLLFPVLVAVMRRNSLRRTLIAAVCISPILRLVAYIWVPGNPYLQYVELPTHCDGLALGALIAIRFRSGPWNISRPRLTCWTVALIGVALAGSLISTWSTHEQAWSTAWDRTVGYSISSAGCACLVLWLICFRDSRYTRWMRISPLQYLGKISYGVYLLHPIALWSLMELAKKNLIHFHKDDPLYFVGAVSMSLAFASISWHFFEKPLLGFKRRFSYDRNQTVAVEKLP